eukprot:2214618-Lingulodinium_polyedra.AAC.1
MFAVEGCGRCGAFAVQNLLLSQRAMITPSRVRGLLVHSRGKCSQPEAQRVREILCFPSAVSA